MYVHNCVLFTKVIHGLSTAFPRPYSHNGRDYGAWPCKKQLFVALGQMRTSGPHLSTKSYQQCGKGRGKLL